MIAIYSVPDEIGNDVEEMDKDGVSVTRTL